MLEGSTADNTTTLVRETITTAQGVTKASEVNLEQTRGASLRTIKPPARISGYIQRTLLLQFSKDNKHFSSKFCSYLGFALFTYGLFCLENKGRCCNMHFH